MLVALLFILGLVGAACSGGNGTAAEDGPERGADGQGESAHEPTDAGSTVFPGADWVQAEPESMGLDGEVLDDIASRAEASGSNCMAVARHGRLVGEWYWNGTDADTAQEVFSATKSFASTLVGIAADKGDLDISEPAATYIPEWGDGPSDAVTIRNLLANDSGREWSLSIDYGELIRAGDKDQFAIDLGQDHEPGTVWAYNNSAIQTLDAIVRSATGRDTSEFAREHLLDPIGMAASSMSTDEAGNTLMFMGLKSTCRDMARFGHLFLNEGRWGDQQVVSSEWVHEATSPSQELSSAYGYLWWLNRRGTLVDPSIATGGPSGAGEVETGQMVDGAPESMYWARGLGGQIVAVDPGSGTVAVRLAPVSPPEGAPKFGAEDLAEVVTLAVTE